MNTLPTDIPPTENWNIATVCDIRIGELFRDNPYLRDKYLDIDPVAISQVLNVFNPDKKASLIFTATHDMTLNPNTESMKHVYGRTITDIRPWIKKTDRKPISVQVGVGGSFNARVDINTILQKAPEYILKDQPDMLIARPGRINKLLGRKMLHSQFDQMARITYSVYDEWHIQKVSVHELRHASNSDIEINKNRKAIDRVRFQKIGKYGLMGYSVYMVSIIGLPIDTFNYWTPVIAAAASVSVAAPKMFRGRKELQSYILFDSPNEVSARAAERAAHTLPQIISFKTK